MFAYFKLCQNVSRAITTSAALMRNHYDVLGITPSSTQADVKAAYYKLSKVYHPDRNENNKDAADKFRSITEAYEVLGNVKLRRLYDKGMHHVSGLGFPQNQRYPEVYEDDDPTTRFYRSRDVRHRPPPPTGRTPIYDYDEWARTHYGATFAKDQQIKKNRILRKRTEMETHEDIKVEKVFLAMGIMIAFFAYMNNNQSEDRVVYQRPESNTVPDKIDDGK